MAQHDTCPFWTRVAGVRHEDLAGIGGGAHEQVGPEVVAGEALVIAQPQQRSDAADCCPDFLPGDRRSSVATAPRALEPYTVNAVSSSRYSACWLQPVGRGPVGIDVQITRAPPCSDSGRGRGRRTGALVMKSRARVRVKRRIEHHACILVAQAQIEIAQGLRRRSGLA